jgi:hypothetical protein
MADRLGASRLERATQLLAGIVAPEREDAFALLKR